MCVCVWYVVVVEINTQSQKKEQSRFYSNLMGERMTDDQKQQARFVVYLCLSVCVKDSNGEQGPS